MELNTRSYSGRAVVKTKGHKACALQMLTIMIMLSLRLLIGHKIGGAGEKFGTKLKNTKLFLESADSSRKRPGLWGIRRYGSACSYFGDGLSVSLFLQIYN